jgi:hypothetical protein
MATGLSGGFVVAAPLPCRACVTGRHIAHTCSKAKPNTKTGGKKAASKKDAGPKLTVGLKIEHCFGVGTKDANWLVGTVQSLTRWHDWANVEFDDGSSQTVQLSSRSEGHTWRRRQNRNAGAANRAGDNSRKRPHTSSMSLVPDDSLADCVCTTCGKQFASRLQLGGHRRHGCASKSRGSSSENATPLSTTVDEIVRSVIPAPAGPSVSGGGGGLSGNPPKKTGVNFDKNSGKWRARIGHGGTMRYLGYFTDFDAAAAAYDEAKRLIQEQPGWKPPTSSASSKASKAKKKRKLQAPPPVETQQPPSSFPPPASTTTPTTTSSSASLSSSSRSSISPPIPTNVSRRNEVSWQARVGLPPSMQPILVPEASPSPARLQAATWLIQGGSGGDEAAAAEQDATDQPSRTRLEYDQGPPTTVGGEEQPDALPLVTSAEPSDSISSKASISGDLPEETTPAASATKPPPPPPGQLQLSPDSSGVSMHSAADLDALSLLLGVAV